jgi:DnaK suppressor protein
MTRYSSRVSDEPGDPRQQELLSVLTQRREEAKVRWKEAFARQQSGEAAGDSEGVHGWKASREGSADVALLEMLDATIQQIDAALDQLRRHEYGRCAVCAQPIALARLRALPFATRCVPCQSAREGAPGPGRAGS